MMETDSEAVYIPRVNGHMLNNYIEKQVLLVAELISVSILTFDSLIVVDNR